MTKHVKRTRKSLPALLVRLEQRFLSLVPGTRQFRRRYQRKILKDAKDHLQRFAGLTVLDAESNRRLLRPVRHYVNLLSAIDTWRNSVVTLAMSPFIVLGVLGICVGPLVITKIWLQVSYSVWGWIGVFYLYLLVFGLAVIIVFPWALLPRQALDYLAPTSLVLTWAFSVVVIYIGILRYAFVHQTAPVGVLKYVVVSGLTGVVSYSVLLLPALAVVTPIEYALKRRRNAMHPDAVLVTGLLEILWLVERQPAKWTDLHFKRQLLSRLEEVASCIQHDLPRMLRTRDVATDLWLRGRAEQIAAAFRALKKWVSTPMADTRDQFIGRIADSLVHASAGDWDALTRMEVEQLSRPQLRSRVLVALRVFLIAAIPMVVLWVVQRTPLALEAPAAGYASAGVFVWAALTVLAALDPLLAAKLAAFKDVSAVLPFRSREH